MSKMKEGWKYKRFDEIMSPAKVERCGNRIDLPVLSITMRGGIVEQNDRFKKTIASLDRTNYKIVKDGQLVIAFPIDEGLLYTQDVAPEGIMSPAYNIWDVDYSQIDRRFLVAYFHSTVAFAYYKAKLRGSTQRRRSMDKADLLSMPIPVPSLDNQQQIVSELDLLSGVIEKQKTQLEELDKLAQSIFYDMFGDPVTNEKGWRKYKMNDLCEYIVDCPHSTPIKSKSITKYPCIRTSELKGGSISWDSMQYLEKDEYEKRITRLKPIAGDIVFGREGTIGDAVVLPEGYFFSLGQRTMLLRAKNELISNIYLHKALMSEWIRRQISNVNVSSTVAHVNIKDFKCFDVPLPPLSLQQEFAAKVEAIEAMKAKVRQSLKEAETLFNERMDYYFN